MCDENKGTTAITKRRRIDLTRFCSVLPGIALFFRISMLRFGAGKCNLQGCICKRHKNVLDTSISQTAVVLAFAFLDSTASLMKNFVKKWGICNSPVSSSVSHAAKEHILDKPAPKFSSTPPTVSHARNQPANS